MSNLGPVFEDDANYSPGRMNAKSIVRDTGTNIVAIATTKQIGAACPTDTSAGLIEDTLYVCEYDGFLERVSFKPVFAKHLHDQDDDASGGRLMEVYHANISKVAQIDLLHANVSDWHLDTVGAGTSLTYLEATTSGRLQFDTGGATNNCITGSLGGVVLAWTNKLTFVTYHDNIGDTSLLCRLGINVDRVDETQSTSRRQMGIEACDGHGLNWVLLNANGNTASLVITPSTMTVSGGARNYKVAHIPSLECRFTSNGVTKAVSTTNVAASGATDGKRLFRVGIKTTSSTPHQVLLHVVKLLGDPTLNYLG